MAAPERTGSKADDAPHQHHAGAADSEKNLSDEEKVTIKPQEQNDDDYPQGLTLFFLTLALALGMFMMALDNVGFLTDRHINLAEC